MRSKKQKLSICLLALQLIVTLLVMSIGEKQTGVAYANTEVKQLKDLEPGTHLSFAGTIWILLDPETGYIFRTSSLGKIPFNTSRPSTSHS